MKKALLVISLISVLLLAGCNKNENIDNVNITESMDIQQQEMESIENRAGVSIMYEDGLINIDFSEEKRPVGRDITLKYECMSNGEKREGDVLYRSASYSDNYITGGTFNVSTSLKDLLNKDIIFTCYINGVAYAQKTLYIDKICDNFDFYTDLVIMADNSFVVKGWEDTFVAVDENGNELKLFNVVQDRNPLNTSFFGDSFIAEDGYLYSFDRFNNEKIEGAKVFCKRISTKKIVNYSLNIITNKDENDEFNTYDITITYEYEDGTSTSEKINYAYYYV